MSDSAPSTLKGKFPERFQEYLDLNDSSAFWAEIERLGTPLMEPVTGSDEYLITFVARGDENTTSFTGNGGGFFWKETPFKRVEKTDIWFAQVQAPRGHVGSYVILKNLPQGTDYWDQRKYAHPDEFNRRHKLTWAPWPKATGRSYSTYVYETPRALPLKYLEKPAEAIRGRRLESRFTSNILGNTRDLFIYFPLTFEPGMATPLLIAFDGSAYFNGLAVPTMLDNMIAEGAIPPLVALFPCSIDTPTRNRELPCHPDFIRMLCDELLPLSEQNHSVNFTGQPVILAGSSYGGLASLYGAVMRPDRFTHVLSQAGAFYGVPSEDYSQGHSWRPQEIARTGMLPQKLYFDAGTSDNMYTSEGKHPSNLEVNRALHEQLRQMKYGNFKYLEYSGGHDYACWQRTFPIGLEWLLNTKSL